MSKWKQFRKKQQLHCCGRNDAKDTRPASILLREMDGGGGSYMVIDIDSWSVDSKDELQQLIKWLKKFRKEVQG